MNDHRTSRRGFLHLPTRLALILYSVCVIYPLLWTVLASFKSSAAFYDNPFSLPTTLNWDNYVHAFEKASLGRYFANSLIVTATSVAAGNLLSYMAAFALARYRFIGASWLKRMYLSALFIPAAVGIVPAFMLLNSLHLLDSRTGLILMYTASALPFTIYLLIGFLGNIPKEYEEAAMIDGCGYFRILFRIIAPMTQPALITVTIFNFMAFWNEYLMAVSFLSSENKRTLTLGLAYLMEVQRYATDWGALFAGLVVVMLPTLLLYGVIQNRLAGGIALGGIKG